MAGSVP